jgi:D-alanyl-D-alanine carboxypeptidase/D-alanyl-D-alanine-endopeptidase (penicillin-binding protein 4)
MRVRLALTAFVVALPLAAVTPAQFQRYVARTLAQNPVAQAAVWGIRVVDLETGRTFYESNPRKLFVPASNTKLFTTALALERLGPEHRFTTRVLAASAPDADGVVRGDVLLIGGGDPNFSARTIPYRYDDEWAANSLAPMNDLADQIVRAGVRRITGAIVGDDTRYAWQPFPDGWAIDDAAYEYGAPVSALSFNDSIVKVTATAEAIEVSPEVGALVIHNRLSAPGTEKAAVRLTRMPLSDELVLTGSVAEGKAEELFVAVPDPALFAAQALREALAARGVRIDGRHIRTPSQAG